MKFGFRKFSLKKRIAARTSWKRVLRHRVGLKAPRGFGWFTNPKKALYNRVYYRTTVDPLKLLARSVSDRQSASSKRVSTKRKVRPVAHPKKKSGSGLGSLIVVGILTFIGWKIFHGVTLPDPKPDSPVAVTPTTVEPTPGPVSSPIAAAPVETDVTQTSASLEDQLRDAIGAQQIAQIQLTTAQNAVKANVVTTASYIAAKQQADAAQATRDSTRSSGGTGLIQASQNYLALSGAANSLITNAYASDPNVRAAQKNLNEKNAIVASLKSQIAERDRATRLAAIQQKKDQADAAAVAQQQTTGDGTVIGGTGVKDEHVNGYLRKDGTYVHGYDRRSH